MALPMLLGFDVGHLIQLIVFVFVVNPFKCKIMMMPVKSGSSKNVEFSTFCQFESPHRGAVKQTPENAELMDIFKTRIFFSVSLYTKLQKDAKFINIWGVLVDRSSANTLVHNVILNAEGREL